MLTSPRERQKTCVVTVLADGPCHDENTNSGVAKGLVEALEDHHLIRVRDTIDVSLRLIDRILIRIMTIRLTKYSWDRSAGWGLARPLLRSIKRSLAGIGADRRNELAIHVRNFYFPSRYPYAPFIDTTLSLRQKLWPEPELGRRHYWVLKKLEHFYLKHATIVFVAGEHVRREVLHTYGLIPERVVTVGAGTPVLPVSFAVDPPVGSNNLTVLFVGKEFNRKGGPELLEAVRKLREADLAVQLIIAGPTSPPENLYEGVEYLGRVNDKRALSALYQRADIFCLPAKFEPYGLVVLEALSHSLPVVVTRVCELPELVQHEKTGLVVDPNDSAALVDAIRRLCMNLDIRSSMSANALDSVKERTWHTVVDKMIGPHSFHDSDSSP